MDLRTTEKLLTMWTGNPSPKQRRTVPIIFSLKRHQPMSSLCFLVAGKTASTRTLTWFWERDRTLRKCLSEHSSEVVLFRNRIDFGLRFQSNAMTISRLRFYSSSRKSLKQRRKHNPILMSYWPSFNPPAVPSLLINHLKPDGSVSNPCFYA